MTLTGASPQSAMVEVLRLVGRPETENGHSRRWRQTETYPYADESGQVLFEVVRFERGAGPSREKKFQQRRPNGSGGWTWNLNGVRRVPYHLPKLLGANTAYVVEGEKDVHTLESWGVVATCNSGGCGSSALFTHWGHHFRARHVVILPDNDDPGRKHAFAVATALLNMAASVRVVEIPGLPLKGDVTDWRNEGGTLDQLRQFTEAAPAITRPSLAALRERWNLEACIGDAQQTHADSPFRLTDDAVLYIDSTLEKEPQKICGRLEVAALTRDSQGEAWGRLLLWRDPENRLHKWAMPMAMLAGDGNEYRGRLLDGGLFIAPGRKNRDLLTVYLQTERPIAKALCVSRLGWHGDSFVLPDKTFGPPGAGEVLFQTAGEIDHHFAVSGTVDDWRDNVGRICSGNSRLVLAVSCAFAGPMLSLVNAESGGVHFCGLTSTGKTTALLVGGSVAGGGGRNGFVQSWRTTVNGLEAIAELHNDLPLFLDELAQLDACEATDTAYLLGNGSGKGRMSRAIGLRKRLMWKLIYVSAGEVTLADHAQTAGKKTRGGAEVRLLNITADAGAGMGMFENIHGSESPATFARDLQEAARRYYGAPLRSVIESITRERAAATKCIEALRTEFLAGHLPRNSGGEVVRVAQRVALIGAAGEFATQAGITGWIPGEAINAAAACLRAWLDGRGTTESGDLAEAIRNVRHFVEVHGSARFQPMGNATSSNEAPVVRDRAGFRRGTGDEIEYLIFPEVFKREVCAGYNYRDVAHELIRLGLLENQAPELTMKTRLPGIGNTRVFAVQSSILEG